MKFQTVSLKYFFCSERRDLLCSHSNGDRFTYENNMLFLRVKISCFRAKAHLAPVVQKVYSAIQLRPGI